MFSTQSDNCTPLVNVFDIIFVFAAELEESKIDICGEGLRLCMKGFNSLSMIIFSRNAADDFPIEWDLVRHCLSLALYFVCIVFAWNISGKKESL